MDPVLFTAWFIIILLILNIYIADTYILKEPTMDQARFIHYMLGIPELDAQHRTLVEAMEDINSDCRLGNFQAAATMANELYKQLTEHFVRHEAELISYGYHSIASHINEHNKIKIAFEHGMNIIKPLMHYKSPMREAVELCLKHIDEHDRNWIEFKLKHS